MLQPDLVFFTAGRRALVQPDRVIRSAPDLVVEILSPATERVDRGPKMRTFARFAVPECWLVDPVAGTMEVYAPVNGRLELAHLARGTDIFRSVALPDFAFPAAQAFVDVL